MTRPAKLTGYPRPFIMALRGNNFSACVALDASETTAEKVQTMDLKIVLAELHVIFIVAAPLLKEFIVAPFLE
jgi:hypothetical protein